MQALTIEQFDLGDPRIRAFARVPWRLYRKDPSWTPPLNADLLGSRLLGAKGLLTSQHPYHRHAEVTHFIALRGMEPVGRISAAVNHRFNEYYGSFSRTGFFGFFETEANYETAAALLDAARTWLVSKDMTLMRGPGEYSNATHERQGVLIDGFGFPPTVECTHNPPYYGQYLERWGLEKAKDYVAYLFDLENVPAQRLSRVADGVRKRNRIETRTVRLDDFGAEVRRIIDVYNKAWAANWGFLPIELDEADALAESLRPIVDAGLVRFASVDGEIVAVLGAFPDPNWSLRPRWGLLGDSDAVRLSRLLRQRRHIPRVRLMFFGIVPGYRRAGVDAVLFDETYRYAVSKGYKTIEASLLLEDNDLIVRPSQFAGGREYKRWRIYEKPLQA